MGIVIKGVDVLQSTRRIDTVVFDKTGTITTGVMQLVNIVVARGTERNEVLKFAGALEHASEHRSLAQSQLRHAKNSVYCRASVSLCLHQAWALQALLNHKK